jgi:hypothetical protein
MFSVILFQKQKDGEEKVFPNIAFMLSFLAFQRKIFILVVFFRLIFQNVIQNQNFHAMTEPAFLLKTNVTGLKIAPVEKTKKDVVSNVNI